MAYRLVGLTSIKIGDSTASASLTTITPIVEDSANLIIGEPAITTIGSEEYDDPDMMLAGANEKTIEFATRNLTTSNLVLLLGGTAGIIGSGTTVYWESPAANAITEKAIVAESKVYDGHKYKIEIPKALITTTGNLRFAKTNPGDLAVKGTIEKPDSGAAIKITIIPA